MLIYEETILLPVGIYLFKVKNKNPTKHCEICPKLTKKDIKTTSIDMNIHDVALVSCLFNFEHILLLVLLFLMLTLN